MLAETILFCSLFSLDPQPPKFMVKESERMAIYPDRIVEAFKPGSEAPRVVANRALARRTLVLDLRMLPNGRSGFALTLKNYLNKDDEQVVGSMTIVDEYARSLMIVNDTLAAPIWIHCEKPNRRF